ncbi:MAG TPA: hypothetical protein VLM85_30465 [Polyangiaceae bacterium]|nr:hypothetical protein [Polyangiaceae bacterium]
MRRVGLVLSAGLFWIGCHSAVVSTHAEPPAEPDAGATDTLTMTTFAIDSVRFGESDNGKIVAAWRSLGYDLDGKLTTKDSTDVCTLTTGAPKLVQADGDGGIDNSFAATVMPLIVSGLSPNQGPEVIVTDVETAAIQQGRFTLQIQVQGLSQDPAQTALGLRVATFASDALGSVPAFDSTTDWPVLDQSVEDGKTMASGAVVRFEDAYVTGGTLVAGMSSRLTVPFRFIVNELPITLAIHGAILTFDHVDAASAANGVLAGVLDVNELIDAIRGFVDVNNGRELCGSAFDGIAQQLAESADILVDRYNAPGIPCDGVSIAIGFHATRVANPTQVAATPTPPRSLCDDGGTPDGATAGGDAGLD